MLPLNFPTIMQRFRSQEMQPMDAPTLIANALKVNVEWIDLALEGLDDEDLRARPNTHCLPIGWLLWHQYRVEDRLISVISGQDQTWLAAGWHARFGLSADPTHTGQHDTLDQVMALHPSIHTLKGYGTAVREKTLACLQSLTATDLDRELPVLGGGAGSVGDYLEAFIRDHFQHSGQVCYLRTYLKGEGWLPR